jgi:Uma2 family endonuclease
MGDPEHELMSADDFLVWIETQDAPHELADGVRIRLTAGTPQSHNVVASNMLVALVPRARRAGCRVTRGKTAVRTGLRGIRYPDVVVDCGPFDPSAREATGPVVVVEVSSSRTSSIDVTDKLDEYRAHVGLRLILFVDPDVLAVKVYRRDPAGAWQVERFDDLDQSVGLLEIGASLSLRDIYDTLSPRLQPHLRVI